MPLAVFIVGLLVTVSALKGTEAELASKLEGDLTGPDGFIVWLGALATLGAVGYIPGLQQVTRWMIALVFVVIVLSNQGFADNLFAAFSGADQAGAAPPIAPAPAGPVPTTATPTSSGGSGSSGGGSGINIGGIIGGIASFVGGL